MGATVASGVPLGATSTGRSHTFTYVMQINISTRHGDISEATKEKIAQKVEKLQRFFDRLTSVDVTVNLAKADEPSIEIAVRPEKREDFVASYQSGDMFGAVDQVIAKLEQQIKKHKEKLQERGKNVPLEDVKV
ncbi:MAG: ribosome-associated translation inhibitor RaiA [Planctomycetaceae bacterium]|nr:ribosome-associated translation inhibitor RaiA [Planctomycetaceae bacterium]